MAPPSVWFLLRTKLGLATVKDIQSAYRKGGKELWTPTVFDFTPLSFLFLAIWPWINQFL